MKINIQSLVPFHKSELGSDDDRGTPYRLIQNEPTPAPTKPTFSANDHDDASTLTRITDDLVALHIGYCYYN